MPTREWKWIQNDLIRSFSHRKKPSHFVTPGHCKECEFWEAILQNFDPSDMSYEDVSGRQYDALSFCSKAGLLFLMPGLCRITFETNDQFLYRLLSILDRLTAEELTAEEKQSLSSLIEYYRVSQRPESQSDIKLLDKLASIFG